MQQDNINKDGNGKYSPTYPKNLDRPLKHGEMDYNLDLIGKTIKGYLVMGSGPDGDLDLTNDIDKVLQLYKVTAEDVNYISNGASIDDYIWIPVEGGIGSVVTGDLIPDTDVAYDLGSPTNKFRDLYLSNNTLYLGDHSISITDGKLGLNGTFVDFNAIEDSDIQSIIENITSINTKTSTQILEINDSIEDTVNSINTKTSVDFIEVNDSITTRISDLQLILSGEISDGDFVLDQKIDTVSASLGDDITGAEANIRQDINALVTSTEAFAQLTTSVQTAFNTASSETVAGLDSLSTFLTDADEAIITEARSLNAAVSTELTNNNISIGENTTALAIADAALIELEELLTAEISSERLASTAEITSLTQVIVSADEIVITEARSLNASISSELITTTAGIASDITILTNEDTALSNKIDAISAGISTDTIATNAAIDSVATAYVTSAEALANRIDNLTAEISSDTIATDAAIDSVATAYVTSAEALAQQINSLKAEYTIDGNGDITGLSSSSAILETINTVVATGDQATLNSTTSAIAQLDGKVAGVTSGISASIDNINSTIDAQYTLEVNADGNVAGMKLGANETGSSISFTADSFKVSTGGPQGELLTPFSIIDGQVAFNGAVSFSEGPQGPAGTSSYLYVAYANNSTGTSGFSITDSTNKTYIGQYTSSNETQSTNAGDYTWNLIKGEQGAEGPQGDRGPEGPQGPAPDTSTYLTTSTNINGGQITTGIIKNGNFAIDGVTDLTTAPWNTFSTAGMGINLDKGAINTKNFYIDPEGNAEFNGTISSSALIAGNSASNLLSQEIIGDVTDGISVVRLYEHDETYNPNTEEYDNTPAYISTYRQTLIIGDGIINQSGNGNGIAITLGAETPGGQLAIGYGLSGVSTNAWLDVRNRYHPDDAGIPYAFKFTNTFDEADPDYWYYQEHIIGEFAHTAEHRHATIRIRNNDNNLYFSAIGNKGSIGGSDLLHDKNLTIDLNNGNVGIGTAQPSYKTDIVNTANDQTTLDSLTFRARSENYAGTVAAFENNSGINTSIRISDTVDDMYVVSRDGIMGLGSNGGWSSTNLNIKSNGFVGIGNRNPSERLHIKDGNLRIENGRLDFYKDNNDLGGYIGGGSNTLFPIASSYKIVFLTGSNYDERMRLTDDGRLLLNAPDNASAYNSRFEVIGDSTDDSTNLTFKTSGHLGIGTYNPGYKLDVTGAIRASGDIIAFSDERVKENIIQIDSAIDKVKSLRGVQYNKIGEDKKSIGVIAQEIEKIIPEVVHTDSDGMKSVAYGNITSLLIEAIKDQQKQIDNQQKQIDELKNSIQGK